MNPLENINPINFGKGLIDGMCIRIGELSHDVLVNVDSCSYYMFLSAIAILFLGVVITNTRKLKQYFVTSIFIFVAWNIIMGVLL